MGLEIPKSHLYKKFGIPKPEEGEAVTQRQATAPQLSGTGTMQLKLKAPIMDETQNLVDHLAEASIQKGGEIFAEMLQPVISIIDKTGSLEELQLKLKDRKELEKLYRQMETPSLEELLRQGIYLADLIGRAAEDG